MAQRSWMSLSFDAFAAGVEAQQVIALRLAKMARGGEAASHEAELMVSEKTAAAMQVQQSAALSWMTGAGASIPSRTLSTYRRKMRANRRRLLRELA